MLILRFRAIVGACLVAGAVLAPPALGAGEFGKFAGWQGIRVIPLDARTRELTCGDFSGNGRQQLLITNSRKGRLEIIRWLEKGDRLDELQIDPDSPNLMPMALEFGRDEIAVDQSPRASIVADLDGDGNDEVIVLVIAPNKIFFFDRIDDHWAKTKEVELLDGTLSRSETAMRLLPKADGTADLYVAMSSGLQVLSLADGGQPTWLDPREDSDRVDWWFTDLDADGDRDLLEWRGAKDLRWYEALDGRLLPSRLLSDRNFTAVKPLERPAGGAEILTLDERGTVRRYALESGGASIVGKRRSLPLPTAVKDAWCAIQLTSDSAPSLVYADPKQPSLILHTLSDPGWGAAQQFPGLANIVSMAAPLAKVGTLLMMQKDSGDLFRSDWQNGRLSYPRPWQQADADDRAILTLEHVGTTVWWAQRAGDDLFLYVWKRGSAEPTQHVFAGLGAKADRVAWLGGARIAMLERFASSPKLATIKDGDKGQTVETTQPSHLKKLKISDLRLLPAKGDSVRVAKLTGGVLQWLDDELQPVDQVMLPEGKHLSDYVTLPDNSTWGMESGGGKLHRFEEDAAGIPRVVESVTIPDGSALFRDPIIGLNLRGANLLTTLSQGTPRKLELIESVDNRKGLPTGIKEATVHRFRVGDVTGDGVCDVLLFDDVRRQLSLFAIRDNKMAQLFSWPVFDDKAYPYGGASGQDRVHDPKEILALDLDGDSHRDLAMICHDRLLIYLGREEE